MNSDSFRYTSLLIQVLAFVTACIVIFVSRYLFIFFVAAMLPTIVSVFVDNRPSRCSSATVCTFNFIGVAPYIQRIFNSHNIDAVANHVISDLNTWLVVYLAAFIGQVLIWSLPELVAKIYTAKANLQIKILNERYRDISEEWGIEKLPKD